MHQPLINQSVTMSPSALAINNTVLAELCAHFHLTASFLTVPVSAEPIGIIDSLQFLQTSMNTFHRFDSNPFEDTSFVDQLTRQPEKTVVISGFSTEIGVMFTALGALRRDYRVIIAIDAVGSRSTRTESAVINSLTFVGVQILPLATFQRQLGRKSYLVLAALSTEQIFIFAKDCLYKYYGAYTPSPYPKRSIRCRASARCVPNASRQGTKLAEN